MNDAKPIFDISKLPIEYQRELKEWISNKDEYLTGKIDEYDTSILIWKRGQTYKIIRMFNVVGRSTPAVSVDLDNAKPDQIIVHLLLRS
jgi:hypothetical protein